MSVPHVTVTGHRTTADDQDAAGRITFALTSPLVDAAGNVIVDPVRVHVELEDDGTFSVALAATSGDDIQPVGVVYRVTEELQGAPPRRWLMSLPDSLAPTVDIADLTPVDGTPDVVWTAPAAIGNLDGGRADTDFGGIAALDAGGAV